jgi:hypothetical protein
MSFARVVNSCSSTGNASLKRHHGFSRRRADGNDVRNLLTALYLRVVKEAKCNESGNGAALG